MWEMDSKLQSTPNSSSSSKPRRRRFLRILKKSPLPNFVTKNQANKKSGDETPKSPPPEVPLRRNERLDDLEELQRNHKDIKSAFRYLKLVVEKNTVIKLPDTISIVLEYVINIDSMLDSCLKLVASKDLVPIRATLHSTVAELVKWSDSFLLQGSTEINSCGGVTLIKKLEDCIEDLVTVATPRLQKEQVNREIRNSLFLFSGESDPDLLHEGDNESAFVQNGHTSNSSTRDSGISDVGSQEPVLGSIPPPKPPLPPDRDSGQCSFSSLGQSSGSLNSQTILSDGFPETPKGPKITVAEDNGPELPIKKKSFEMSPLLEQNLSLLQQLPGLRTFNLESAENCRFFSSSSQSMSQVSYKTSTVKGSRKTNSRNLLSDASFDSDDFSEIGAKEEEVNSSFEYSSSFEQSKFHRTGTDGSAFATIARKQQKERAAAFKRTNSDGTTIERKMSETNEESKLAAMERDSQGRTKGAVAEKGKSAVSSSTVRSDTTGTALREDKGVCLESKKVALGRSDSRGTSVAQLAQKSQTHLRSNTIQSPNGSIHGTTQKNVIKANFLGIVSNHDDDELPPALPEKKRALECYMGILSNYTTPSDEVFKRPPTYETASVLINSVRKDIFESITGGVLTGNISLYQNYFQLGDFNANSRVCSPPPLPPKSGSVRTKNLAIMGAGFGSADSVKSSGSKGSKSCKSMGSKSLSNESMDAERINSNNNSLASLSSLEEDESKPMLDCQDVKKFLIFRDEGEGPILHGGAMDALVVYATQSKEEDLMFYEAFLTTYRTFILPKDIIDSLIYREKRFRERGHKKPSIDSFILLLRIVDELTGHVERSVLEKLINEVLCHLCNGHLILAKTLRDRVLPKCGNYWLSKQKPKFDPLQFAEPLPKGVSLLSFHSEDIAKQMTLIDAQFFYKIEIPEILAWGKEQNVRLSPNLTSFTEHFNKLSYWCRTYILNVEKQQERERVFMKFLKVMKHLRRMNNFNSFLSLLSALDSTAIRRLDFPKSSMEALAEYAALIESAGSFKAYRSALADAKPPCIPYLGLILQDVTFVYLGNPDELPDGKVNFVKRWQLFNILDTFRKFKLSTSNYGFIRNDLMVQFFGNFENHMTEDEIYDKSLQIKPRASSTSA